jgi:hypothetical protein
MKEDLVGNCLRHVTTCFQGYHTGDTSLKGGAFDRAQVVFGQIFTFYCIL